MIDHQETIVALSTPPGQGAIGVIRLSGSAAIAVADKLFKGKKLGLQPSHTLHFGRIINPQGEVVDEVVAALFKGPYSYTGEDVIEFSCHGSPYILQQVLSLCIEAGARPAQPGEFTRRAFLNGRLDLTQAEAVADLIGSESKAAHHSAMHQLRGGFSKQLKEMREQLINFAALIELELDFGEEDVEFADRTQLHQLLSDIQQATGQLIDSFRLGNAVKNGVAVAIIGAPNAGKSTLLNTLLNEERAIVSNIAGTTRDTIEEVLNIQGMLFRLIDTAGIRESKGDVIEDIGMEKSKANAAKADIILYLKDLMDEQGDDHMEWLHAYVDKSIVVHNKMDLWNKSLNESGLMVDLAEGHYITASDPKDAETIKLLLYDQVMKNGRPGSDTIITNTRHLEILQQIATAVADIRQGMEDDLSGDLLSHHIRQALFYIGELTGEVQVDRDILGTIFGKFCIGK